MLVLRRVEARKSVLAATGAYHVRICLTRVYLVGIPAQSLALAIMMIRAGVAVTRAVARFE